MDNEGRFTFVIRAYDENGNRLAEHTFDAEDATDLYENEQEVFDFFHKIVNEQGEL
jgi:hypothetical protein